MDNNQELLQLIGEGEGQTLEFKKSFGEETLESICAFANADGGKILVGVADDGTPVGLQIGRKTLEDWAYQINEAMDPRIKVDIEQSQIILKNNQRIVVVTVPQSHSCVVSVRGRYLRRVGKTNQRMNGEDIAQKLMSVTKLSWDSGFEDAASLDDLDLDAVNIFIELLNKNGRRSVPKDIQPDALLTKLGMFENGKLTRAAVLLLGASPQKFYPYASVKVGRFKSQTMIEDEREIRGCLIKQMSEAMDWLRNKFSTKLEITENTSRTTRWEYPLEAVREAVANALCHRDYRLDGNIQIRLFDSHLEFWNPGSLSPALSVADLLKDHDSIQRNTKVAEGFYNAGFIEKWGTGTLRMAEFLKEQGHPGPEFETDAVRFRLRFRRSFSESYLRGLGLNERQTGMLLALESGYKMTNNLYCAKYEVVKRTASRELGELLAKGLLKKHGSTGKGTFYTRS
jgi:ATP-dependent DNA helicase RecG